MAKVSASITLAAGVQTLRIYTSKDGGGWNLNWWEIVCAAQGSITQKQITIQTTLLPQAELFPSPAHDQFTMKINTKAPSQVKVEMLRVSASAQKQMIIQKPEGVPYISLSLSGFPAGQYFVRLTVNNAVKTLKLTKL